MHLLGPAGYKVPDVSTRKQRLLTLMAAALFTASTIEPAQEIKDAMANFVNSSFAKFREDFHEWALTASPDLINLAGEHLIKVCKLSLTPLLRAFGSICIVFAYACYLSILICISIDPFAGLHGYRECVRDYQRSETYCRGGHCDSVPVGASGEGVSQNVWARDLLLLMLINIQLIFFLS